MSTKRTTRSASAKPVSKPAAQPPKRPISRAKSTTKRVASPDPQAPPPKRSRATSDDTDIAPAHKPFSRSVTGPANAQKPRHRNAKALSPVPERQSLKAEHHVLNPVPKPPEKTKPCLQLFVWGAGNFGQFGMGPNMLGEIGKPKKNPWIDEQIQNHVFGENFAGLEAIAAGGMHTIFIDEKGTVWTCGVNDDAALGRVTKDVPDPNNPGSFLDVDELTSVPHPLQSLIDENFRAVKIAAGDSISAAISAEGELRVWGSFRADEGSLGFSSERLHQFLPSSILKLSQKPGSCEGVASIAAGNNHLLVLTTDGNIYTWGAGEQSQLGRKVIGRRKIHGTNPEKITLGTRSRKAIVVGAGNNHSFAVDEHGDVWGWGLNAMGQTGTGYMHPSDSEIFLPKRVIGLSKTELRGETVVEIVGGYQHTLFRTSDGKVYSCGRSNAGQLGLPDDHPTFVNRTHRDFIPEPVLVPFPDEDDRVLQISAGVHNSMAVTAGGALYVWGQGVQSELGAGDETEVRTPKVVVRKEGGSWTTVAVSCGGQHSLGLFRKKL